jgi:cytochrome bd-type quinol oxidase subunit 1
VQKAGSHAYTKIVLTQKPSGFLHESMGFWMTSVRRQLDTQLASVRETCRKVKSVKRVAVSVVVAVSVSVVVSVVVVVVVDPQIVDTGDTP